MPSTLHRKAGLFPLGPRLEYYNHTSGLSVFDVLHGDSAYYPTLRVQHTDTMEVAVRGGLRCLQTLRKLQLCGNKLRSKGAKTLLVALRGHPALTQLSIRTNLLHDSVARFVAALLDSSPITDLDLSDNKLGSKGVRVVAQAGARLEELDVGGAEKVLGSSKLFLASVSALGRTCVNLSELTLHVLVDCIVLKNKGAAALASGVIPVANALTSLSAQCCEIGDKGMCDLIRAVGAHGTLVLRACGNKGTHSTKMARLIAAHLYARSTRRFWTTWTFALPLAKTMTSVSSLTRSAAEATQRLRWLGTVVVVVAATRRLRQQWRRAGRDFEEAVVQREEWGEGAIFIELCCDATIRKGIYFILLRVRSY